MLYLKILGITAVEDLLQEGVPEVIEDFHKAGIKFWMITGDKMETAENIGYISKMIDNQTQIFYLAQQYVSLSSKTAFILKKGFRNRSTHLNNSRTY